MTAIAMREDDALAPYLEDPTGGRLVAWAQAASAANKLAQALCKTSFVPQAYQGKEYDATAAILMGDELGLKPLAALRSIFIVHGSPSMYARTMVALAQSRGHEIWTELDTADKVIVCGQRKGSSKVERSEWTVARARKAGYTSNKKYESNPQEMLYAKAATTVARKIAADVLAGVPYSVEELELDNGEPSTTTVSRGEPTKARRRTVQSVPLPEPELDEPTPPEPDATPGITDPQAKHLFALYHQLGIDDRDERLADLSARVGRTVASSSELSKDEASAAIESLIAATEGQP